MRKKLSEWEIGDNIMSEKTPFMFNKDHKNFMKAAPMAYVVDLKEHILKYLDLLDVYVLKVL